MRRLVIALGLALLAAPATAQVPYPAGPDGQSSLALISPTAPATDSSNRIATTAWANSWAASALPLASGKVWIGSVGNIATPQTPSGDLTVSNAGVFTFGTVNSNVGSFGSATLCATVTVNAKGLITAASAATCTPAIGSITGLGAGVATWLGTASSANLRAAITDETGTGLAYFQGGDLGTPSAGVATNLTGTAAGLTAGAFSAGSAANLTSGTLPAARTNGHMNGTATNDNGAAGEVGEFISSNIPTGSAVSLTTGTTANVTSISLTAGDWDVSGNVSFNPGGTTTVSNLGCWISTTSAAVPTNPNAGAEFAMQLAYTTGATQIFPCGRARFSLASTTTVFLEGFAVFGVSTMTANGFIGARRSR